MGEKMDVRIDPRINEAERDKALIDEHAQYFGPMFDPDDVKTMMALLVVVVVLILAMGLVMWAGRP